MVLDLVRTLLPRDQHSRTRTRSRRRSVCPPCQRLIVLPCPRNDHNSASSSTSVRRRMWQSSLYRPILASSTSRGIRPLLSFHPSWPSAAGVSFRICTAFVRSRRLAYQSLHGAVQRMSMVSPKLGVRSLQRGVSRGFRLFDPVSLLRQSCPLRARAYGLGRLGWGVPVPVRFLRLVVLRRVLRLWRAVSVSSLRGMRF